MLKKLLGGKKGQAAAHEYKLAEVRESATEGRRLAIYDRTTGLYAHWYLELRCEEEISRARRFGRTLACLSLWAPTPSLIERMASYLRDSLRDHDVAGYLNNGHFVVLLTETNWAGADVVLKRIRAASDDEIMTGVARSPEDGQTFHQLLEAAKQRARTDERAA